VWANFKEEEATEKAKAARERWLKNARRNDVGLVTDRGKRLVEEEAKLKEQERVRKELCEGEMLMKRERAS
jgi:hypothetical protein